MKRRNNPSQPSRRKTVLRKRVLSFCQFQISENKEKHIRKTPWSGAAKVGEYCGVGKKGCAMPPAPLRSWIWIRWLSQKSVGASDACLLSSRPHRTVKLPFLNTRDLFNMLFLVFEIFQLKKNKRFSKNKEQKSISRLRRGETILSNHLLRSKIRERKLRVISIHNFRQKKITQIHGIVS